MRAVNFRAFLIVSAAVTCAVLCSYLYMCFATAGAIVGAVYLTALAAVAVVFIVLCAVKRCKPRVAMAFGLALVLSLSAFCFATAYVDSREESKHISGYHDVRGRVCAVDVRSGRYRIDLEDLTVDGIETDGVLRITIGKSDNNVVEFVECGDRLAFEASLAAVELVSDGKVDGTSYRTDIRFRATVRSDAIAVEFGEPNGIESLLSGLNALLVENMGDKYGNIAYSMLTGDKHALDYDTTDYYSAAGLGHIMAVSGLHIGFVVLLLNLILCRVGRKVRFFVIAAVLAAYTVIADFSPSIVRATVMSLIAMFSVFVGGRRDMLSSMLCAYSFILAFKPLYLFDAGFALSFGAMFGIAMFAQSISRRMEKIGAHRKVGEAVGSAVSVQIGIAPAEIYFFGSIQTLALLVNAILIPYISVVFVSIAVFAAIGAIPGLGAVLVVPKYLLIPIDYIAKGIAAVPYSTFEINTTAAVFLCYPAMFFASGFFMMPKGKTAVIVASVAACLAFVCIHSAPKAQYYYRNAADIPSYSCRIEYNATYRDNYVLDNVLLKL